MNTLTLLTAPGCHLCAHAREVLDSLAADGVIRWRELSVDSEEGSHLAAAAPPLRPVLLAADGHVLAYGRLSRRRLARDLAAHSPTMPRRSGPFFARANKRGGGHELHSDDSRHGYIARSLRARDSKTHHS